MNITFAKEKMKKLIIYLFIILLFFCISKTTKADPSLTSSITDVLEDSIDMFFKAIMEQLAVMIYNLSGAILALVVLLFTIDFLLKLITNLGDLKISTLIGQSAYSLLILALVIFLLSNSGETMLIRGQNYSLNNYQILTMGNPSELGTSKSLLTGFMELGKQFFSGFDTLDFSKPSQALKAVFAIPFELWNLTMAENIGWFATVTFMCVTVFSLFSVMNLTTQIMMAFISYVMVTGLSVILLPFLLFEKTASFGQKIVSNIVNKGLELSIRLGLIGVVVSIIAQIMERHKFVIQGTNGENGLSFGTALNLAFILLVSVFIASEGGNVAGAVLSGNIGNLDVGKFVNSTVSKIGVGAMAVGVAGYKGISKVKNHFENRDVKQKEDELRDLKREEKDIEKGMKSSVKGVEEERNNIREAEMQLRQAQANGDTAGVERATEKISASKEKIATHKENLDRNKENLKTARKKTVSKEKNVAKFKAGIEDRQKARAEKERNFKTKVQTTMGRLGGILGGNVSAIRSEIEASNITLDIVTGGAGKVVSGSYNASKRITGLVSRTVQATGTAFGKGQEYLSSDRDKRREMLNSFKENVKGTMNETARSATDRATIKVASMTGTVQEKVASLKRSTTLFATDVKSTISNEAKEWSDIINTGEVLSEAKIRKAEEYQGNINEIRNQLEKTGVDVKNMTDEEVLRNTTFEQKVKGTQKYEFKQAIEEKERRLQNDNAFREQNLRSREIKKNEREKLNKGKKDK